MAIRKILRMGHPVLRRPARALDRDELGTPALRALVEEMTETLYDYGGIGLAAPQIGESVRVAIIDISGGQTRYGELPEMPLTVFVNPVVEVLDPAVRGYWEGCLSVPGLRGFVERPQHVRAGYVDAAGRPRELELQGFFATVLQHELDHLDGKLYIDHIADTRLLSFEEEFERYLAPREQSAESQLTPQAPPVGPAAAGVADAGD